MHAAQVPAPPSSGDLIPPAVMHQQCRQTAELTSRTVPAHLMGMLAEEAGGGLQYQLSDEALVLGAVLPVSEGLIG